jgi:hypothetical protein
MTTFKIYGALLRFADYHSMVTVEGDTVQSALNQLVTVHPALGGVLFDRSGALRRTHRFALNGELLAGQFLHQPVGPADRVDILLSVSGG